MQNSGTIDTSTIDSVRAFHVGMTASVGDRVLFATDCGEDVVDSLYAGLRCSGLCVVYTDCDADAGIEIYRVERRAHPER